MIRDNAQSAEDEKITPIPCANLLGAPMVVLRGFPSAGIIPFVAYNPGLKVGPVNTRAQNPYAKNPKSQIFWVVRIIADSVTTNPATTLAAYSFTVSGNENTSPNFTLFINYSSQFLFVTNLSQL